MGEIRIWGKPTVDNDVKIDYALAQGRVAELVYAKDLKFFGRNPLRVRFPPRPPKIHRLTVYFWWEGVR